MVPEFGNCTGLTEVIIGHFLMDFFISPAAGKYQIMAPDVIPPKCFALKHTRHQRCRQEGGGSARRGLCGPARQGDPRSALAAGFAAGAGRLQTVGRPRNHEHSVLYFAL